MIASSGDPLRYDRSMPAKPALKQAIAEVGQGSFRGGSWTGFQRFRSDSASIFNEAPEAVDSPA